MSLSWGQIHTWATSSATSPAPQEADTCESHLSPGALVPQFRMSLMQEERRRAVFCCAVSQSPGQSTALSCHSVCPSVNPKLAVSASWTPVPLAPPLAPEGLGTVTCPTVADPQVSRPPSLLCSLILKGTRVAYPFVKVSSVKPLLVGVSWQKPASKICWFFL